MDFRHHAPIVLPVIGELVHVGGEEEEHVIGVRVGWYFHEDIVGLTAAQSGAYADSVLYLECALAEFSGEGRPSPEALAAWGQRPLDAVLSGGLASAARNSVLQESGAVLREAKTRIAVLQDGIISDESWRDIDAGFLLLEGAAQMLALDAALADGGRADAA